MSNAAYLIQARQLSKSFKDGTTETQVLQNLDFTLAQGEMVAVLGPSGSGKSTFLHLLGGLDSPTDGAILWQGEDINLLSEQARCNLRGKKLGFVYQFHHLLPEFSALENVMMPAALVGADLNQARERAAFCLEQVGLAHRLTHKPSELSGGERQRTAIARALINQPICVLADEPTGNLDEESAKNFYELIVKINKTFQTAFVIVTHDQAARRYLNKAYSMHHGHIDLTA